MINAIYAKLDLRAPIATMTMETKRHTNAIYQFFEGMNLGINRRNADNIKITTPTDFYTFKALYEVRENQQIFGL